MPRLRDLSLRYKIPLRVTVLVVGTVFAITASLVLREYDQLKRDVLRSAETMGRVLANTLVAPLKHDDTWRAFEIVSSTFHVPATDALSPGAEFLIVLDAERRVYVSTRPDLYPILSDPLTHDEGLTFVAPAIRGATTVPVAAEPREGGRLYMIVPVVSDGLVLGILVMAYSKEMFWPRFVSLLWRAGLVTLVVLAVLLPISWYSGHRTGAPLIELANAMGKIGSQPPQEIRFQPYDSHDEIGRLGQAFQRMLAELREKEALKDEVVRSERLAAIGRLTAGVAHEINNPLGGMLNAISTFKRHGSPERVHQLPTQRGGAPCEQCDLSVRLALGGKTLSLLERGLMQIKDTVAALLVEARVESHRLSPQDVEDTRTLVLADINRKSARLTWENGIHDTVALPSTLVRQILINLLLNAVHAVEPHGHVACRISRADDRVHIAVRNDGQRIPPERLEHLFEPFSHAGEQGHGLGLWVTYQIVRQLEGEITAASRPGETRFDVVLPLDRKGVAVVETQRRRTVG